MWLHIIPEKKALYHVYTVLMCLTATGCNLTNAKQSESSKLSQEVVRFSKTISQASLM